MIRSWFAIALAALALGAATVPASAEKKCPDGKYYDESKGKCVTKRGS